MQPTLEDGAEALEGATIDLVASATPPHRRNFVVDNFPSNQALPIPNAADPLPSCIFKGFADELLGPSEGYHIGTHGEHLGSALGAHWGQLY